MVLAPAPDALPGDAPWRAGVVVHPGRDIGKPLGELTRWADGHGAEVVQIQVAGQDREVARQGEASGCDLLVSIGGDGTMLAALRAAVAADRPVLGIACGSLGVLTTVGPDQLSDALDRFIRRDWSPYPLPALQIARDDQADLLALNDIAIVRAGIGQVRTTARVDGALFARLAGDGCIVSTPMGSSAYALAAGGPLLMPDAAAFVFTPLSTHGGSCPPLVMAAGSQLQLEVSAGHGGVRLEVDGQIADEQIRSVTVSFRSDVATVVRFADQEPVFAGLRRRQIITDSPRIVADGEFV